MKRERDRARYSGRGSSRGSSGKIMMGSNVASTSQNSLYVDTNHLASPHHDDGEEMRELERVREMRELEVYPNRNPNP